MVLLFSICGVIIFAAIGFLIKEKKQYDFISGYNTMSEEKKSTIDIEWMAKILGI